MIPMPIIALLARLFDRYYTRTETERLFLHSGTALESPGGNKQQTVMDWLKNINRIETSESLTNLGKLLEDFLEVDDCVEGSQKYEDKEQLHAALGKHGLRYATGGKILSGSSSPASITLDVLLKNKNFPAIIDEFNRATSNVESEPREAVSAAANILEAICKEYIVQHPHLQMPSKMDLTPVFNVVRKDLGFDPSAIEDDDLKAILGGLSAIVNGVAALRTHASSAHAQATTKRHYRLAPRHARLAVNAAHTVVVFIMETWQSREQRT